MTGSEFRKIRESLGLTQKEFAETFGLAGKNVVSNIETGFRNSSGTLIRVLRLLYSLPQNESKKLVRLMAAQPPRRCVRGE